MLPLQVTLPPFPLNTSLDESYSIGNNVVQQFNSSAVFTQNHKQSEITVIRYNTCTRPIEKQAWNFTCHNVQFTVPQLAANNITEFLKSCHCPPYHRKHRCHDWQCDLPKSIMVGSVVSTLATVDHYTVQNITHSQLPQALAVVMPPKDPLSQKSLKIVAIVKDTNLRPENTALFQEVGEHLIRLIRTLVGPTNMFQFNMTHCHNNSGGYSTITAHNLLLSALKNVNDQNLRFMLNISLMPNTNKQFVNFCTSNSHIQFPPICLTCFRQNIANRSDWCANDMCPVNRIRNQQSATAGTIPKPDKAPSGTTTSPKPVTETEPLTNTGYYTTSIPLSISNSSVTGTHNTNPSFASATNITQPTKELDKVFAPSQLCKLAPISDKKWQPQRTTQMDTTPPQVNNLIACPKCDHRFPQPLPRTSDNEVMEVAPDGASSFINLRPQPGYDKRLQDLGNTIVEHQQRFDSHTQSLQTLGQTVTELTRKLDDITLGKTNQAEADKKQLASHHKTLSTLNGKIGELGKTQQQLPTMNQQIEELQEKQDKMQRAIDELHARHAQLETQIRDQCLNQPVTSPQPSEHQPNITPNRVMDTPLTNTDNTNTFNNEMSIDESIPFHSSVSFEHDFFGQTNSNYSQQSSLLHAPLLPQSQRTVGNTDTTDTGIVNITDPSPEPLTAPSTNELAKPSVDTEPNISVSNKRLTRGDQDKKTNNASKRTKH